MAHPEGVPANLDRMGESEEREEGIATSQKIANHTKFVIVL